MGIDIIGVSNLEIKEVPDKYKAILKYNQLDLSELRKNLNNINEKDRNGILHLAIILNGAEHHYLDKDFNIHQSNKIETKPDVEVTEEAYSWESKEMELNNLLFVEWSTNKAYYKTIYSKEISIGRSYSGMNDFLNKIKTFTKEHIYFPYDGTLDRNICNKYEIVMRKIWPEWRNKYCKDLSENIEDICVIDDYDDWDTEFFVKLYFCLKNGSNDGYLRCF